MIPEYRFLQSIFIHVIQRELRCFSHTNDTGNILGSCSPALLLGTTVQQRRKRRTFSGIEEADTFGTSEFMGTDT